MIPLLSGRRRALGKRRRARIKKRAGAWCALGAVLVLVPVLVSGGLSWDRVVAREELLEADGRDIRLEQKEESREEEASAGAEACVPVFTLTGFSDGQVKVNDHAQVDTSVPPYVPSLISEGPQVLIVHTHTTESYANDGLRFVSAAAFSNNNEQNIVAVGNVFEQVLTRAGIGVVHSHRIHDDDYRHAYEASLETVEYFLEKYPSVRVVLDIHRDSVEDAQGQQAALMGTQEAAQIMFVVGTDGYGKEHPRWDLNLGFAYAWQEKLGEKYASLCRPIHVSKNRYNQHVRAGALIVEVGTEANTQAQALTAARLAAEALVELLGEEGQG